MVNQSVHVPSSEGKPGNLSGQMQRLLAAVREEVGLMAIGGEIMAHVTGGGAPPPPFNPNGPLGLRDAEAFNAMLVGAGFELDAEDNGFLWNWEKIELGPLEGA